MFVVIKKIMKSKSTFWGNIVISVQNGLHYKFVLNEELVLKNKSRIKITFLI